MEDRQVVRKPLEFQSRREQRLQIREKHQVSRRDAARRRAADRRHLHQRRQDPHRRRTGRSRRPPHRSGHARRFAERRRGHQGNREAQSRPADFRVFALHGGRRQARRGLRRQGRGDGSALQRAHHQVRLQMVARKGHRSLDRIDEIRARAGTRSRVLPHRLLARRNELGARSDPARRQRRPHGRPGTGRYVSACFLPIRFSTWCAR